MGSGSACGARPVASGGCLHECTQTHTHTHTPVRRRGLACLQASSSCAQEEPHTLPQTHPPTPTPSPTPQAPDSSWRYVSGCCYNDVVPSSFSYCDLARKLNEKFQDDVYMKYK